MPGCDTQNVSGNYYWSRERVGLGWGGLGATIAAGAATLALGALNGGVILLAALGGYLVGFSIGYCFEWFSRLYVQNPRTIMINGLAVCADRNLGYAGFPLFADGDWTFNIGNLEAAGPPGITVEQIRTQPAPDWGEPTAHKTLDPDTGRDILHCEIGSAIGDAVAVGHMVGTVGGAIAGAMIGAAIGCVVAGIFTFGLGCLIAILIGLLVGAIIGGFLGDMAGWAVGGIIDAANDFDRKGKSIEQGCIVHLEGRWVTDASHQHNEIHDIERIQIINCPSTGTASGDLKQAAAVGTGRHPTGIDP